MDTVQREVPLLAVPDVLVCSVGTEIFLESTGGADEGWQRVLDEGWDHSAAVAAAEGIPELKPQVGQSQGFGGPGILDHRVSYLGTRLGALARQNFLFVGDQGLHPVWVGPGWVACVSRWGRRAGYRARGRE